MNKEYEHCEGFNSELNSNSNVLILGTLPPCARDWYYKKDWMFWRIITKATSSSIDLGHSSIEIKKQVLYNNRIALWDIMKSADRVNGSSRDSSLINKVPNDIAAELSKKNANLSAIIINGYRINEKKDSAFKWFKEYNHLIGEPKSDKDIDANSKYYIWNNIKVYPLQATSAINQNRKNATFDYEELWVKTLKRYI